MRDKRGWLRCDWCGMPIPGDWEDCGDEVEECAQCFHERLVATVEAQAALIEAWVPLGVTMAIRMGFGRSYPTVLTVDSGDAESTTWVRMNEGGGGA